MTELACATGAKVCISGQLLYNFSPALCKITCIAIESGVQGLFLFGTPTVFVVGLGGLGWYVLKNYGDVEPIRKLFAERHAQHQVQELRIETEANNIGVLATGGTVTGPVTQNFYSQHQASKKRKREPDSLPEQETIKVPVPKEKKTRT